jgi:hypothetical protein
MPRNGRTAILPVVERGEALGACERVLKRRVRLRDGDRAERDVVARRDRRAVSNDLPSRQLHGHIDPFSQQARTSETTYGFLLRRP